MKRTEFIVSTTKPGGIILMERDTVVGFRVGKGGVENAKEDTFD